MNLPSLSYSRLKDFSNRLSSLNDIVLEMCREYNYMPKTDFENAFENTQFDVDSDVAARPFAYYHFQAYNIQVEINKDVSTEVYTVRYYGYAPPIECLWQYRFKFYECVCEDFSAARRLFFLCVSKCVRGD